MKAVANVVKCDKKTVKYWLQRWSESKDLTGLQRSGRPRITSSEQDEQIVKLANEQTFATSSDIKEDLETKSVGVSERTIRYRLNEDGEKYNLPMSKTMLTGEPLVEPIEMGTCKRR